MQSEHKDLREAARELVAPFLPQITRSFSEDDYARYEHAAGVQCADHNFREAVLESVALCMVLNSIRLKRASDIRKELAQLHKSAATSVSVLAELRDRLDQASTQTQDLLLRRVGTSGDADAFPSPAHVEYLRRLSAGAKELADLLKGADTGGRPRYWAFDRMVRLLADAFERATGKRATVTFNNSKKDDDQWLGRFLTLVEAVLPKAAAWAHAASKPLARPASTAARGEYVRNLCRHRLPVPRAEGG